MQNIQALDYSPSAVASWDPKDLVGVAGFSLAQRQSNARLEVRVRECARIWAAYKAGELPHILLKEAIRPQNDFAMRPLNRIAPSIFNEAMTRSDFTNLTTFVMDRQLMANYGEYPSVYSQIAKVSKNIRDFRAVERWQVDGGELPFEKVKELVGFNRRKVDTSSYTYSVEKYEAGEQISWEATINDDMDTFSSLPARLALGGARTADIFFTKLLADANGPHASFYTTGNLNKIDTTNYGGGSVNPVLSYQSLAGALAQLMNMTTSEGRPINPGSKVIVMVGDAFLYQTLLNIINTSFTSTTIVGGTKASSAVMYDTQLNIKNWIATMVTPVFNPELRGVVTASSGTVNAKSWWVFADNARAVRPAVEIGFLSGYDTPRLLKKASNTVSMEGAVMEEMGDFESMSTEFKGLLTVGGCRLDPKLTIASNGSGA